MSDRWTGRPLLRREDLRLVQGQGAYLDDLTQSGQAAVVFVRSYLPRARIAGVDATAALKVPGVVGVYTAADLPESMGPLPLRAIPLPDDYQVADLPMPVLARQEVHFAGEAVAAVLAETRAIAEDAAELVQLDLEPLPSVGDAQTALQGGPAVHKSCPDNVLLRLQRRGGDVEAAFAGADHVVRASFRIPRLQAAPIEPRGCLAAYSPDDDLLTLWCSSQDPHRPRLQLAKVMGRPVERIRVVVRDVGGAFGSKGGLAPEYALASWLAMETGRPVKWVETRSENFMASYQGRGMNVQAELAISAQGDFLGLRAHLVGDCGAYVLGNTAVVGATAVSLATGAYTIPNAEVSYTGAATNKVPTGPYRGAGRPEAAFVIERLVEMAATKLDMDPVALRRRNIIPSNAFPYTTALGTVYDSGDYASLLDDCCRLIADQPEPDQTAGGVVGTGISLVVESSGNGAWEAAWAQLLEDGTVQVLPGSSDHGQGHATTFSQIAADALGVSPAQVSVSRGDSAQVPPGVGTYASRSTTVGGGAVLLAIDDLKNRCRTWAAHLLDIPEEKLVFAAGAVNAIDGSARLSIAEIARAAATAATAAELPALRGEGRYSLQGLTYGASACAATVEVEPETGAVAVKRLIAVDDAGTIVNPLLAEGQVQGSAIQGFAAVLLEEVAHDADGQPMTESFINYLMPTAADVTFPILTEFHATPSPLSPLGTKGVAECGTIAVPAAVANAVIRALSRFGVSHLDPPFTPERVWLSANQPT